MKQSESTICFLPRRHHRFAARLPVHYLNSEYVGTGTITNVSLKGWSVRGQDPGHVGDVLIFGLRFDDPDHLFPDTCTIVRWVRGETFGVEILSQSPVTQARLRRWVRVMAKDLAWPHSSQSS